MPEPRRLLPLLGRHGGGRDAMTCQYRCGNACDHPAPNESDNQYFGDIAKAALTRRGLLAAGGTGALVLGVGAPSVAAAPAAVVPASSSGSALTFKPIP